MSASSVPPKAIYTGRPLPSRGSSGVSSPPSSVLSADSDCSPALPPHFVAFAWRYLASCRLRAHPPGTPRVVDPGPFVLAMPASPIAQGAHEPSQVPGRPLCTCPALRPRWGARTRPTRPAPCCLPLLRRRRPHIATFEAPSHGLHTPCARFADEVAPSPRNTQFRWRVSLTGSGLAPDGSQ